MCIIENEIIIVKSDYKFIILDVNKIFEDYVNFIGYFIINVDMDFNFYFWDDFKFF